MEQGAINIKSVVRGPRGYNYDPNPEINSGGKQG